jgi:methionine aminopeptidase
MSGNPFEPARPIPIPIPIPIPMEYVSVRIHANPHYESTGDPYLDPDLLHYLYGSSQSQMEPGATILCPTSQKSFLRRFDTHVVVFRVCNINISTNTSTNANTNTNTKYTLCDARGSKRTALLRYLQQQQQQHNQTSSSEPRRSRRGQERGRGRRRRLSRFTTSRNTLKKENERLQPTRQHKPSDRALLPLPMPFSFVNRPAVKTAREISCIRTACRATAYALRHTIARAHTFQTTGAMRDYAHRQLRLKLGIGEHTPEEDYTAYETILTIGGGKDSHHKSKTGLDRVHPGAFEDVPLVHRDHPMVLMDIGARYGGYCADVTRTFAVVTPLTPEQRAVYDAVKSLYTLVVSMVRPGAVFADIEAATTAQLVRELTRLGVPEPTNTYRYMPHGLGHSVGLQVHDAPCIRDVGSLQAGMVLTIEPGIYTDDVDVRIENTILVTRDGCEELSGGVPW